MVAVGEFIVVFTMGDDSGVATVFCIGDSSAVIEVTGGVVGAVDSRGDPLSSIIDVYVVIQ